MFNMSRRYWKGIYWWFLNFDYWLAPAQPLYAFSCLVCSFFVFNLIAPPHPTFLHQLIQNHFSWSFKLVHNLNQFVAPYFVNICPHTLLRFARLFNVLGAFSVPMENVKPTLHFPSKIIMSIYNAASFSVLTDHSAAIAQSYHRLRIIFSNGVPSQIIPYFPKTLLHCFSQYHPPCHHGRLYLLQLRSTLCCPLCWSLFAPEMDKAGAHVVWRQYIPPWGVETYMDKAGV